MRMKYGFLLKNFTDLNTLPVFRTESQDRMLSSALNFAYGFFGPKLDGQYQQLITIEATGFNNTLAPSKTCPNARNTSRGDRALPFVREWAETYLQDALKRLSQMLEGYKLTVEDVYTMQQMCAYEVRYFHIYVVTLCGSNAVSRRSPWAIQSSASCSPKRNGKDLTTRSTSTSGTSPGLARPRPAHKASATSRNSLLGLRIRPSLYTTRRRTRRSTTTPLHSLLARASM